MATNSELKKIYRIEVPGIEDAINKVQRLNEELELQKAIKREASKILLTNKDDAALIEKQTRIVAQSEIAIKKLSAEKKIASKEADLLIRSAEREAIAHTEAANAARLAAGSVNQAAAQYNALLAVTRLAGTGTLINWQGEMIGIDEAKVKLREYRRVVDDFNRSLSPDGTLVGEYKTGILNAFKELGLTDVIRQQKTMIEVELKELQRRNQELAQQFTNAGNKGAEAFNKIEKELRENIELQQRMQGQLGQINASLGQTNAIGGQLSATISAGFRNLLSTGLGVAGIAYGLQGVFNVVQKVFSTNVKAEALNQSLALVSKTERELIKNQQFLGDETTRLGLEIVKTSQAYRNFYTASTQVGIGANATREIFLSTSAATSALKLSQDDTNGVFLAFTQIASKGKVQAEELRGQIGERLPGAFSIAARAIGVTEAKLNDMLKRGEVASKDFLPKFAAELEKTFGGDRTERINSLQASVNRFSNAITNLYTDNTGKLSGLFSTIIDGATDVINFLNSTAKSAHEYGKEIENLTAKTEKYQETLGPLLKRYDELKSKTELNKDEQEELNTIIQKIAQTVPGAVTEFDQYGKALDINKQKVLDFADANHKLSETFRNTTIKKLKEDAEEAIKTATDLQGKLNQRFDTRVRGSKTGPITDRIDLFNADNTFTLQGEQLFKRQQEASRQALDAATEIVKQGGKLDGSLLQFIERSGNIEIQKLQRITEINKQLDEKSAQAFDAFTKGDTARRQQIVDEVKKLRIERARLLDPTFDDVPTTGTTDAAGETDKARKERERKEREALQNKLRAIETEGILSRIELEKQNRAGLLTEEQYQDALFNIEQTGINKKLDLIAGKNAEEKKQRADLQLELINKEQEYQNKIFEIRKKELEQQLEANKEAAEQQAAAIINDPLSSIRDKAAAKLVLDNQLLSIQKSFNDRMLVLENEYRKGSEGNEVKRAQALRTIREAINKDLSDLSSENFKEELSQINNELVANIAKLTIEFQQKVQGILDNKKIQPARRIELVSRERAGFEIRALDLEIEADKKTLESYKEMLKQKAISQADYDRFLEQLTNKQVSREEKAAKEAIEIEQRKKAIRKAILKEVFDIADDFLQSMFEQDRQRIDSENDVAMKRFDNEEEQRLSQAQSAQEKQAIEAEYDQKRLEQEKINSQRLKDQKLKELEILTAVAILQALASSPPPFNYILAAGVLFKALIEKARINAQQFAGGGRAQDMPMTSLSDLVKPLPSGIINAKPNVAPTAKGDNVLAYVKPGEVILNEDQQARLGGTNTFRRIGVPGFASGGLVPLGTGGLGDQLLPPVNSSSFLAAGNTADSTRIDGMIASVVNMVASLARQTNERIDKLQVVQEPRSVETAQKKLVRNDALSTI